jgi:hypothetical protein
MAVRALYQEELPTRLFWLADATQTEKPSAKRIASGFILQEMRKAA